MAVAPAIGVAGGVGLLLFAIAAPALAVTFHFAAIEDQNFAVLDEAPPDEPLSAASCTTSPGGDAATWFVQVASGSSHQSTGPRVPLDVPVRLHGLLTADVAFLVPLGAAPVSASLLVLETGARIPQELARADTSPLSLIEAGGQIAWLATLETNDIAGAHTSTWGFEVRLDGAGLCGPGGPPGILPLASWVRMDGVLAEAPWMDAGLTAPIGGRDASWYFHMSLEYAFGMEHVRLGAPVLVAPDGTTFDVMNATARGSTIEGVVPRPLAGWSQGLYQFRVNATAPEGFEGEERATSVAGPFFDAVQARPSLCANEGNVHTHRRAACVLLPAGEHDEQPTPLGGIALVAALLLSAAFVEGRRRNL